MNIHSKITLSFLNSPTTPFNMTIYSTYKHLFQLFIQARQEWKQIAQERYTPKEIFIQLILPLLVIMGTCNFLGYQLFEQNPAQHIQMHLFSASATFLFSIVSFYISTLLIAKFAHYETKQERFTKAFTLVGYSFVPGIIFNSLAFLLPSINYLTILGLFSFFILLNIPEDKKSGYFTFILIGLLSVYAVLGAFFIGIASYLGF